MTWWPVVDLIGFTSLFLLLLRQHFHDLRAQQGPSKWQDDLFTVLNITLLSVCWVGVWIVVVCTVVLEARRRR